MIIDVKRIKITEHPYAMQYLVEIWYVRSKYFGLKHEDSYYTQIIDEYTLVNSDKRITDIKLNTSPKMSVKDIRKKYPKSYTEARFK